MKTKLITLAIFAFLSIASISCSNNDDSATTPTTQNPVGGTGFSWRENDPNATTIKAAASASFSNQYKTLIAKDFLNLWYDV